MFGWKKKEVIGNFVPFVSDEKINEFKQLMEKCIREKKLKDQEVVRTRKDGSEGIFLLNAGTITGQQILVLIEDITEVKQYEHKLEKSIKEKEILLAEIHHRVKNNLAIIAGLIELQKDRIDNGQISHLLNETQNRIFSISGVHELLYEAENFSEISLSDYIDQLIDRLQRTYQDSEKEVQISKNLNSFSVNINQAVPLGLLLNELITNSFKHAFGNTKDPEIRLTLEESGGRITSEYTDNGSGMAPSQFEKENSLGLNLIRTLLNQIGADYQIDSKHSGFCISFTFEIGDKGSQSNI
jgi:two-component sensor histidine kinase